MSSSTIAEHDDVDDERMLLSSDDSAEERRVRSRRLKIASLGFGIFLLLSLLLGVTLALTLSNKSDSQNASQKFDRDPNVIFFIADGFGPVSTTFYRQMNNDEPTPLDSVVAGTVRTRSSSSLITDSAAGATAYSCALRTYNGAIAVTPELKACGTVMEAAQNSGRWRTALVATSRITHATPAAWSSHVQERGMEYEIAAQQAGEQSIDLMFGGGLKKYVGRPDGVDLLAQMRDERGYTTLTSVDELDALTSDQLPIIGLFASSHMSYEIDRRRESPEREPSLSQMTERALELLSAQSDGKPFFAMVEASRIDMASHLHDAAAHYWEVEQYMRTVDVVKRFVDEHPNTIAIAVADHETGGVALGAEDRLFVYPPYEWYPNVIRAVNASSEKVAKLIAGGMAPRQAMADYCAIEISDDELAHIEVARDCQCEERWLIEAVSNVVAERARIGWTTPGHSGVDINLHHFGVPVPSLGGNLRNMDVGSLLRSHLGLDDQVASITESMSSHTFPPPDSDHRRHPQDNDYTYFFHD
jgi:alkaline phosphatase